MDYQVERLIPRDHPSLAGHFPGAPIVPGVIILEEVAVALKAWRNSAELRGVELAKFLQPLLPEQPLTIQLRELSPRHVGFSCLAGGGVIAEGRLELANVD